ncbi:FadR/GntR family transcriptional regulator [Sphingomonas morindae]|uniref:FadR family transcriptional regulator n=1 Tax=Sphingomonas morindae TaxID=1541170 RepID=A0ABY4X4Y1_9SPHN|nr:FadR/GntR family transcriptional regulator [Sphingomonas morindae]USI71911.1 FadR family transcriptional regulator [Sphingomonas morindae]
MTRAGEGETFNLPFAAQGAQRIHGSIARDLGVAILIGRYAPGDTLPGEVEFAEQLKVSRGAYREAVRILAAKGMVESRPKTGTRVSPRARWNVLDPEVLAWTFEAQPSEAFIRELFELRMIVEPAAAELAARRRSGEQLARMGHALQEMAQHGLGVKEGRKADQLFHNIILEAAANAPLLALSSSIAAAVSWTTIFKQRKRQLPRDPLPDHLALFAAIADGDSDAARTTMTELIRLALEDTELSLRES